MSRHGESPQDAAIGGGGVPSIAPTKKKRSKQSKKNKAAKKNEPKTENASTLSEHYDEVLKTADHLDMLDIKEVVDTVSEIAASVTPTGQEEVETKEVEKEDSAAVVNKPTSSVGAIKTKNRKRRNRKNQKSAKEIPSEAVPVAAPDRKDPEEPEASASELKPHVLSYSQVVKPLDARAPDVPTATVSEPRAENNPSTMSRTHNDGFSSSETDYEYYVNDDSGDEWHQDYRGDMDGTGY